MMRFDRDEDPSDFEYIGAMASQSCDIRSLGN